MNEMQAFVDRDSRFERCFDSFPRAKQLHAVMYCTFRVQQARCHPAIAPVISRTCSGSTLEPAARGTCLEPPLVVINMTYSHATSMRSGYRNVDGVRTNALNLNASNINPETLTTNIVFLANAPLYSEHFTCRV